MATTNSNKPRKLRGPQYDSFRIQKRIKTTKPKLPSVKVLSQQTWSILKQNKKFFAIYTLLYGVLCLVFIQSAVTGLNIPEARDIIGDSLGGPLSTSVVLYVGLIGTSAQLSNQMAAFYQFSIVLVFSLAVIYGLRHMYGKEAKKVTVKESLYKGMTPLIPVLLVLLVLALQLLPVSIGTSVYATVVSTGLAVTGIEKVLWLIFVALLGLLSLYLLSGSIFALFIVTLPDMTPMRALRASREVVRFRRLAVIRKIIFLPIILLVLVGLVVVPFIILLPVAAQMVFFVTSALVLPTALTYMYNLYRSMI